MSKASDYYVPSKIPVLGEGLKMHDGTFPCVNDTVWIVVSRALADGIPQPLCDEKTGHIIAFRNEPEAMAFLDKMEVVFE